MSSDPLSSIRHFKKGELIFKAGDASDKIYLVQQGLVSITMQGRDGAIELYKAAPPQLIGEEVLSGHLTYGTDATTMNDTIVLEVPAMAARTLINGAPPMVKFMAQGLLDKLTEASSALKAVRREADATPCPPEKIAKLFSVIFQVGSYAGKKKNDVITVAWPAFRKYCQRVFLESPVRLEQSMWLLVKLGLAKMEMVKSEIDPEAPEELGYIHFRDLNHIGRFAEFYRHAYNPSSPESIMAMSVTNPEAAPYLDFLKEIDLWNANGLPQGMPLPPDPNAKFPPKKKAS